MSDKKKESFFNTFLNNEEAISDAENYENIKFYQKSKNILILF